MMFKFMLILPVVLLFIGLVFLAIQLFKVLFRGTESIVDSSYNCLEDSPEKVRIVSRKYGNRIRGSVRLSQGRIKSMSEITAKETNIIFP